MYPSFKSGEVLVGNSEFELEAVNVNRKAEYRGVMLPKSTSLSPPTAYAESVCTHLRTYLFICIASTLTFRTSLEFLVPALYQGIYSVAQQRL